MTTSFASDLLKLIFQATAIANIADNAGTSPVTSLFLSLHTADPTASGNQASSECNYASYARFEASRDGSYWGVASGILTVTTDMEFPTSIGGGTQTAKYLGVGTGSTGVGKLLYSGALTPNIGIFSGIAPIVKAGSTVTLL